MPLVLSIACAKEILLNIISAHDNKNRTISNIVYDLKKNSFMYIFFYLFKRVYYIIKYREKRESRGIC